MHNRTLPEVARIFALALGVPALLLAALMWLPARAANDLELVKLVDGLSTPVYVTHAGDGTGRLFVVEKGGVIRIIKNGQVLATPFLDISGRVANNGEAGMLSVAFPPDFSATGYFYVYYNHLQDIARPEPVDAGNNAGFDTVVARFRVTSNPDVADPASEQRILVRNQPYENHNGGLMVFGPDGKLYIGLGDGGSGGDPQNQAQNTSTLLGKMLRIEVSGTVTYTIPADNPFRTTAGAKPEIWHYGLRNPWRWSFDRATGDLLIGDVGQGKFEEINFAAAGESGLNFGWRCKEANSTYNNNPPCTGTLTDPIAAYGRDVGQSVTGGYVYRGKAYPQLLGTYFFADFVTGRIWSMTKEGTRWTTPTLELDTGNSIASFGEDENGELYIVDLGGGIYRLNSTAPQQLEDKLFLPAIQGRSE
jgi:glucose/arabinose dehydrogenase